MNFFERLLGRAPLKSPVPDNQVLDHPSYNQQSVFPQAAAQEPEPVTQMYRNPRMSEFQAQNPQSFNEISSGVELATEDPLKRQIMMDLALEESGMRTNPPPNPLSSASGPWQFINATAMGGGLGDTTNATDSARLLNSLLDKKNLHYWEVLRKGGATKTPLEQLYSKDELNQYLRGGKKF